MSVREVSPRGGWERFWQKGSEVLASVGSGVQDDGKRAYAMRVTHVTHVTPMHFGENSYYGGGERYVMNVAAGLREGSSGDCAVKIVSFAQTARRQMLRPGVLLEVLPVAITPESPLDSVSWDLPDALLDADVVHLHHMFTRSTEAALVCAKMLGKPVYMTDHGARTSELGASMGSAELADGIICQSDFAASLFQTSTRVDVIRGGVDTEYFSPSASSCVRDIVLYVGRLLPHKGVERLINALPKGLRLVICGRPYSPRYFRTLKRAARGRNVIFVLDGDDETVRGLYRSALVVAMPSTYEDCYGTMYRAPELMGLSLLEGMASGASTICSRVGGMPEFVSEGETGFVVDTDEELAERLEGIREDPKTATSMGEAGRQAAVEKFDVRVVGNKILTAYERTLGMPR